MSSSSALYERERLGNDSRTKKLLFEKLRSGDLNGTESPSAVQKSHPLFRVQEKNCFRNCWATVRSEHAGNVTIYIVQVLRIPNIFS